MTVIGLTGTFASGKGTVAEYLIGKGYVYSSLSDELRLLARQQGIPATRDGLRELGNGLRRKKGDAFLAGLVADRLKDAHKSSKFVVDGIRNTAEAALLRRLKDFTLVAVDAPADVRYHRAKKRGTQRDPNTFSEFLVQERREFGSTSRKFSQQVNACIQAADFKIDNSGDYKNLYKQIEKLLSEISHASKR